MNRETKQCLQCKHHYLLKYMAMRKGKHISTCKVCDAKRKKRYKQKYNFKKDFDKWVQEKGHNFGTKQGYDRTLSQFVALKIEANNHKVI